MISCTLGLSGVTQSLIRAGYKWNQSDWDRTDNNSYELTLTNGVKVKWHGYTPPKAMVTFKGALPLKKEVEETTKMAINWIQTPLTFVLPEPVDA